MLNPVIYIILILFLIYIAFLIQNQALLLIAFVLTVFFAFALASAISRLRKVNAFMEVPIGISEKGRENLVKITITNADRNYMARTKVLIVVKDLIRGKRKYCLLKVPGVSTGENEFVESIVFHDMGKYEMRLKYLRVYDFTGLLHLDVSVKGKAAVQVLPSMSRVPVRRTEVTKNFYGEAEVYDENLPGYDANEIFQIREYQKGDRLQNVHWKLTAKHDNLVVKEHSLPRSCPVVLFMDYHPGKFWGEGRRVASFIEAVAGISFSIMESGCPHYVVWYDKALKDVVRLRVDDEESIFYFISILMEIEWSNLKGNLGELYKDKYRAENFVREFTINDKLLVKKGGEVLGKLSRSKLEKTLEMLEVIL